MIGHKLTLWRVDDRLREHAYRDQCGVWQQAYVVRQQIPVVIIEVKKVCGLYNSTKLFDAYRAKAIDTEGEFTIHWNGFDEANSTPGYYWDLLEDSNGIIWQPQNAARSLNLYYGRMGFIDDSGAPIKPIDINFCAQYNKFYHIYDMQCINCRFEQERKS